MQSKTAQLQIRVSPAEKAAVQAAARRAGMDMSAYVLSRVIPAHSLRFAELTESCSDAESYRFALAELNTWLADLTAPALREAVANPPTARLKPYLANYVAAMVEYACGRSGIQPPEWTAKVPPLADPVFGSELMSLRLHLLANSPPPFRQRNIFIDSSIGSRL